MKLYAAPLQGFTEAPGEIFIRKFLVDRCLLYPLCADGERRVP